METIGIVVIVMEAIASLTKIIDVVTTIRGACLRIRHSTATSVDGMCPR